MDIFIKAGLTEWIKVTRIIYDQGDIIMDCTYARKLYSVRRDAKLGLALIMDELGQYVFDQENKTQLSLGIDKPTKQ